MITTNPSFVYTFLDRPSKRSIFSVNSQLRILGSFTPFERSFLSALFKELNFRTPSFFPTLQTEEERKDLYNVNRTVE